MAQVREEDGLALLVDATFASPINFRPLEHGADVVITSATKYLNGHSDVHRRRGRGQRLGGRGGEPPAAALGTGDRSACRVAGRPRASGPWRCGWSGTTRTGWRSRSGPRAHPAFARVHYPGLASHPDHALAASLMSGFGGMVGLELKGGAPGRRADAPAAQAGGARAQPGRRREPDLRAAAHLPQGISDPRSARRSGSRTASCG